MDQKSKSGIKAPLRLRLDNSKHSSLKDILSYRNLKIRKFFFLIDIIFI